MEVKRTGASSVGDEHTLAHSRISDGPPTVEALTLRVAQLEASLEAESERARTAEASHQAKTAFVATLGRNLLTPMNGIIGFTRLSARRGQKAREHVENSKALRLLDEQERYLEQARVAGQELLTLINQAHDLAKAEVGLMDVFAETEQVRTIVESVCRSVEPLVARASNRLVTDLPEDIGSVTTDGAKLRRVLIGLLSNAASISQKGSVTLQVTADGDSLVFEVIHTGPGMSAEALSAAFEPFAPRDPAAPGTAKSDVGLSVVKALTELLGGDASVSTERHIGSCFTVRIPRNFDQAGSPMGDERPA